MFCTNGMSNSRRNACLWGPARAAESGPIATSTSASRELRSASSRWRRRRPSRERLAAMR